MSAYDIASTMGQTVCREIREKMGYSLGEMAQLLGISKATYQGYDQGTRTAPKKIVEDMQAAYRRDAAFFRRYRPGGTFDRIINRLHPHGIMSKKIISDDE